MVNILSSVAMQPLNMVSTWFNWNAIVLRAVPASVPTRESIAIPSFNGGFEAGNSDSSSPNLDDPQTQ